MSVDENPLRATVPDRSEPYVVKLAPWTQKLPTFTRGSLILRSIGALILGGMCAVLVIAMVVVGIYVAATRPEPFHSDELAVIPVSIFAWYLLRSGVHYLRYLPAGTWSDRVQFAAPYAFTVTPGLIHFPGGFAREAEDWPLAGTTVEAVDTRLRKGLLLRCDGFKTRQFPARGLTKTPTELQRIIEDRRNARRAAQGA